MSTRKSKSRRRHVHINGEEWSWICGSARDEAGENEYCVFIYPPGATPRIKVGYGDVFDRPENTYCELGCDPPCDFAVVHPSPSAVKDYILKNLLEK